MDVPCPNGGAAGKKPLPAGAEARGGGARKSVSSIRGRRASVADGSGEDAGAAVQDALGDAPCVRDEIEKRSLVVPSRSAGRTADVETERCGSIMGGFQLLEMIGEGGMGEVYKAKQLSLDRLVALKVLLESFARDRDFVARFEREARNAAKLSHPNIVGAVDVGKADDRYYFAMEFIDGRPVTAILEEKGKLSEEEALDIIVQAARGLEYAWRNGMVHRDIKPDNLLMTKDGVVKIADLGLAREASHANAARLTHAGTVVGTPYYVSPEQVRDENVDTRADIYSLGVTFYQLVTGELPFKGCDALAVIAARLNGSEKPVNEVNPDVSDEVARVIGVMMARDKEDRYPDPRVLLHDLGLLAEGGPPEFASFNKQARARAINAARKMNPGTSMVFRPKTRKRSWAVLAGGIATAGIAVSLAWALRGRPAVQASGAVRTMPILVGDSAAAKKLATEAAVEYEVLRKQLEQGQHDEVLAAADVLGIEYAHTGYGARFEALRLEAMRMAAEEKRLAAQGAAMDARYAETVRLARDAIGIGDHAAAMGLLVQAGAGKDTAEVRELMLEARRLQHLALARGAEAEGDLARAVDMYRKALARRDDDSVKARIAEASRRIDLALMVSST